MLARQLSHELAPGATAPRLDPGRCVRGRFTRASCRRCADACPRGAIAIGKGPPVVSPGACAGCRLCQASCPTGAVGDADELGRALDELGDRPRPVLGCRVPGVEAHDRLSCLGLLDAEALLALGARFPGGVTLNLVHCAGCAGAAVVPALRRRLEELQGWAGSVAARVRAVEAPAALDYERAALSRRQFFSIFGGRGRAAANVELPDARRATPEPGSARRLPAGRRSLLRVLEAVPARARAQAEARFFPSLSFSAACRGCTACAGVCPTGAIAVDAGDPPRPVFERSACTGCGACAEFCRRGAIALSTSAGAATACG